MSERTWGAKDEAARELERRVGLRAERDARLAEHTTMRVGGPADLLITVRDRFTLRGVVRLAQSKGWPLRILGRGSNVVISDVGVRGIVLLNRSADVTIDAEARTISADSGLAMAKLATVAADAGLTGAEFTLAIPGNLGGAIWANAGAHGGEMSQILQRVVIMRPDGREEEITFDALNLSYRHSRFKEEVGRGEVILGATMLLRAGEPTEIKARLEEIRRWRREHQPLGIPSAGSVFRNPPAGPSAGALIEAAGLKGRAIGGAEVSTMHANWILNRGGATAAAIRELHDLCIHEVQRHAGLTLESEIQFIGEEPA
ncbi:MAG: UDP-N-acetylmuramate dehydrogenase [Candidatus Limnocylindrus sp.]